MRREKSNYIIQAVVHALDVLEEFYAEGELGVTELSKRLALHKNNVSVDKDIAAKCQNHIGYECPVYASILQS